MKKVDSKTKEGLDNVEFELLDKNKRSIKKVKTDKNGNIIILKIMGKYGFRRNIELYRGIGIILSLILWYSRSKNE